MESKYAGIMVSNKTYKKFPDVKGRLSTVISFYEEAAEKNSIRLCYFKPSNIDFETKTVTGFTKEINGYKLQTISLPTVIFRRTYYSKSYQLPILKLCNEGYEIYNLRRFKHKKYEDYNILKENPKLNLHLPDTKQASVETIKDMMGKYKELMIKPNGGSVGQGIMKLEYVGEHWSLYYKEKRNKERVWTQINFKENLPDFLIEKISKKPYIVQERIHLATVRGAPFDMRVSVQKNARGRWQVSGIIAKLAGENQFLTNIHQGGTAYTLDKLLKNHPTLLADEVKKSISDFSLKAAKYIESQFPKLADLGFDIGINKEGFPYFIELNTVSDYPALTLLKETLKEEEWKNVFTTPIDYAGYLLRKKKISS